MKDIEITKEIIRAAQEYANSIWGVPNYWDAAKVGFIAGATLRSFTPKDYAAFFIKCHNEGVIKLDTIELNYWESL